MPGRNRTATDGGRVFTVEMPTTLEVERRQGAWWSELDGRDLRFSNLDKPYWPDEGYTKGDLLNYYFNVGELILPYLRERPLTMKRMPDGVAGPFFYEKSAPSHTPEWIARCTVPSEDAKTGMINYLMVNDLATLLYVANLGCIEMHPLHSRCATVEQPDYLFFDLDPMEASFEQVLRVALHVRAVLDVLGLESYPKTSGATGVQIYVPIEPGYSYQQVRDFVGTVGHMIERADREHVTMAWKIANRTGKVFIDHNMNREGANISAVYSMRPEPLATVSTPLVWDELEDGITPQDFRIDNAFERWNRVGDLFAGVLREQQDLSTALEAVGMPSEKAIAEPTPRSGSAPTPAATTDGKRNRTSEEVIAASKDPNLAEYLRKRTFGPEGTPEPPPPDDAVAGDEGREFVIQKHRATRLHYDVRLQKDGAMPSWAVPRGLPTQRGDRRLAVRTEDHPIEYNAFHGTIPKGHYGAGEVRIFDNGTYERVEWDDKKVSFKLHGRRYPGLEFHFVKTRTDWLAFLASAQDAPLIESPPAFQPMLAEGGWRAFDDPKWWFEPKFDGIRSTTYLTTDATRLMTRSGRDVTNQYPELHMVHELVDQVNAVIDAEIVAFDGDGTHSFEALQQRMNLQNEREIKRMSQQIPVAMVAFDLLWLDGHATIELPLEQRRELLLGICETDERLQTITQVDGEGVAFAEAARGLGLEGVVGKRKGSRYQPGRRSPDWRKVKLTNTQDCVILGWTPGQGGRAGTFGALLVGAYDADELIWIGQVGTGFTHQTLERLLTQLHPLKRPTPPIRDPELRRVRGATFVEPQVVCEVEYLEITKSTRKMRAPSFKGIRTDKTPEECVLETPRTARPARASKRTRG
jgi:DNA ligase D-like protein (predicted ligase)/DNA ligase D-like protein (predicted polymerase)/DNA ligase D-like protein (predicted 3'-phosphoesterase)